MIKRFSGIVATVLFGFMELHGQTLKRLYLANDDHTDYMWTANEAGYDSVFVKMLDYYLDQIDSTQSNPADFQARFNCDGSIWLQAYQRHKSAEQFERLISRIRSGHISVPLHAMLNCYGAQPTEAVIRGMYYAGQMERKHKLRFQMAGAMENNTLPLGLSSLWAGSGARFSWYGIGGYGSQMTYEYRANRRNQLYNYRGLDSTGVIMKWYIYDEKKTTPLGSYAENRTTLKPIEPGKQISQVVNKLDSMINTPKYPFHAAASFGYGHDDLDTYVSHPYIDIARKLSNPSRKIRVSVYEDFFKDIATNYTKLPSESVTYGNEWDLYSASMNETTAKVRRATEKLRTAEALASVVSLTHPGFADYLTPARNKAWDTFGYYWEHDWTGDSKLALKERPTWQNRLQQHLTSYVDTLQNLSINRLGSQISTSENMRFFVFNALNWNRSDVADFPYQGNFPVKVVDLQSAKEVACQLITKGRKRYLRIWAENIPSVGYKVFELQKGKPSGRPLAAKVTGEYVSNSFYKLRLSPSGAITEIFDKRAGNRLLVKITGGKYVNDLGGGDSNKGNPVTVEHAGPVSVTLKAVSEHPIRHTVRITFYANSPRIEIEDSIQANFGDVKTWSFSLNLNNPTTRYEELGAILTAKKETRGGHYAAQNARYDWQTFNHFADMSEKGYGVTISNLDCSFFKLGQSTVDSLWENASQLNALAGGRVDKKREDGNYLGFENQNGEKDFLYQFAITSHQSDFDALRAMKFSMEHQNPLVTGEITGTKSATASATIFSLLSVTDPNILLWSVKPSEEGMDNGLITRFWNMSPTSLQPTIKLHRNIRSAWQTTHIETNEKELKPLNGMLPVNFKQHQINTFRLIPETK